MSNLLFKPKNDFLVNGVFGNGKPNSDDESNNHESAHTAFLTAQVLSGNIGKGEPKSAQDPVTGTKEEESIPLIAEEIKSLPTTMYSTFPRSQTN